MNIYDISKKSGYSIATVSRVVNGKENVSEKATKKIMAIIDELGYIPNAYARGLGTGSLQTIGLVCLDVADMYLAGTVSILERQLRSKGYHSLLACTGPDPKDKVKGLQIMLSQNVDAIFLIGSHFLLENNSYIVDASKKVPIIFLNGDMDIENIYCVFVNDQEIVENCTQLLLDNGRKNILYLYDKKTPSGTKKLNGYRYALAKAHMPKFELLVDCDINTARSSVISTLKSGKKIDAVVASEDLLGIAALKAALELGLAVPTDIEIVGYNNSSLATCSIPELTSIDSKMEALCTLGISTLFGIFEGKSFPSKTMLSASIIKRSTTNF